MKRFRVRSIIKNYTTVSMFDRDLKRRQITRNLRNLDRSGPIDGDYYDYLRKEVASRLVDRLKDITRNFPVALELGTRRGHVLNELLIASDENYDEESPSMLSGITTLIQSDFSECITNELELSDKQRQQHKKYNLTVQNMVLDDEFIPFDENTFDLVISSMSMHWINDLPSSFTQINKVLKPDGAFIGAMIGGTTLQELRHCLYLADQERRGGISPHTSPYTRASDIAGIMQGCQFALPTVDIDTITIGYPNMFVLLEHLQKMGESNANLNRQLHAGADTFLAAASIYQDLYGLEDGTIPATFQIISMIGWKSHESQLKACQRGSATKSLKDLSSKPDLK